MVIEASHIVPKTVGIKAIRNPISPCTFSVLHLQFVHVYRFLQISGFNSQRLQTSERPKKKVLVQK